MKKLVIAYVITLLFVSGHASAAIKCAPDGRGGTCCWDTTRDGPFKPIGCM
jgi:hypothetical protein